MTIYVVKNINGDIIGVADNQERAVEIYLERYSFEDADAYYLATPDQISYLEERDRVDTFLLNEFYYA